MPRSFGMVVLSQVAPFILSNNLKQLMKRIWEVSLESFNSVTVTIIEINILFEQSCRLSGGFSTTGVCQFGKNTYQF